MNTAGQKTIFFCGGGSGGHVIPALTVIGEIQRQKTWRVAYIGSHRGVERELVGQRDIPYYAISTGKLRRYWSWQNFTDCFKIVKGLWQSFILLWPHSKNDCLVFSFGGFVSVPAVLAAWIQGKAVYLHEQTTRAGLANKIAARFADKIFLSFEDSITFFPARKSVHTGYPVRRECFSPDIRPVRAGGKTFDFKGKDLLFITGGANGSLLINQMAKNNLPQLKQTFQILHQVGQAHAEEYQKLNDDTYTAVPFIGQGMIDLFKGAKVVASRSGAGTVAELLACRKPSLFIPLKISQKNEQLHNARQAQKKLGSLILEEDELNDASFLKAIETLRHQGHPGKVDFQDGLGQILAELHRAKALQPETSP